MTARAIILAAGRGARLQPISDDRPKGLIEIGGEPLVGRSIRLLREAGVSRVTLVAGYCAEQYRRFAAGQSGVEVVLNERYETTGSMASLASVPDGSDEEALILESDIIYEQRALAALAAQAGCATLVSGPTGAGDEVWVHARDGRLRAMSKKRNRLPDVAGELVGITRMTPAGLRQMREAFAAFVSEYGHARMDYETDALVAVAGRTAVAVVVVPDLLWGEIDDEAQYDRVVSVVWPAIRRRQ